MYFLTQKKFRFIAIVILSTTLSLFYSCSTPFNAIKKNTVIGTNKLTNSKILANEFVFPENVYDFYIDTTKRNITVKTRGFIRGHHLSIKGYLYQYDISLNYLKWFMPIDYKDFRLYQLDSSIFRVNNKKIYRLNSEDGKRQWSTSNDLFYVSNANIIAFENSKWYRNKQSIFGIDINNGKSIWNRNISLNYRSNGVLRLNDTVAMLVADGLHTYNLKNGTGWDRYLSMAYGCNEILKINDSTKLIVADGLHSVNLKTGTGWDFKEITGAKDYTALITTSIAGIGLGLITGNLVYSGIALGLLADDLIHSSGYSVIYDAVSNVLIDSSKIYWASKQNLIKLDTSGNVLWENSLPKDEVSKSHLFLNDSIICMLNFGYAFSTSHYQNVIYGQPFIAGFNKNSGNKLYYQLLKDNKNPVIGYKVVNNALLLFSNSKLSKYSMSNGELIKEKAINTDSLGLLDCYVSKNTYVLKDSILICLNDSNSTNYCILTKNKKIIQINDQLEVMNKLDNKDSYVKYLVKNDFKFVGNSIESYILDKNNNVIANIKASNKAVLIGTKLYDKQKSAMVVIDLKDIIEK